MLIISGSYPSIKIHIYHFLFCFYFFCLKINKFKIFFVVFIFVFVFVFFFFLNVLYWFIVLNFMNFQNLIKSCELITDLLLHKVLLSSYYCMTIMSVFRFLCGI